MPTTQIIGMTGVQSKKLNTFSKGDLLINKRASGRPKDLADYSKLQDE